MQNHCFQSAIFQINALDCPEEFSLIRKGIGHISGIHELRPDYLNRSLHVEYDSEKIDSEAIAAHLQRIGFLTSPILDDQRSQNKLSSRELPRLSTVFGIFLLLDATILWWFFPESYWAATLAVLATIVAGIPVVSAAIRAVRLWHLDMNTLMSLAAAGAIATGEFFEAATAMCLFGISIWLESFSLGRARRAVQTLVRLTPTVAHRIHATESTNGDTLYEEVDPSILTAGDKILVKPGERVPIDGKVLSGQSTVDQAPITGESMPVEKNSEDLVFAGSLNGEGSLVILAGRSAQESTMAHIARLVEQAQSSSSPTARFIDKFARVYTPVVIALALCLVVVPPSLASLGVDFAQGQDYKTWFHRGLVLLVIACPCALVISTPLTIVCGIHQATRHGILIKGGEYLEEVSQADCVVFDKTGTITMGSPCVVEIRAYEPHTEEEILSIAASLESHSEHPLARAIVQEAQIKGVHWDLIEQIESIRGFGVCGVLGGETYFIASPEFFSKKSTQLKASLGDWESRDPSYTVAMVGTSQSIFGALYLADRPRPHAAESIKDLRKLGIEHIVILTGDRAIVAESIAKKIGIKQIYAGLLPEDKVSCIEQMAETYRHVIMVGDGVNDAPALAAANVGIALGSQASDTVLETADIVILSPQLDRLSKLIRLGRITRRRLSENIILALTIKAIVLVLAAIGLASMWMAVAADVGAGLLVIFNGLRILQENEAPSSRSD